jgi:hypothetical protein
MYEIHHITGIATGYCQCYQCLFHACRNNMQQEPNTSTVDYSTATLLLLDAPNAWLAQLLSGQYLDSDSKLTLFQTCKKLNEMVMQNSSMTAIQLGYLVRPRNRILNILETANRHSPSINLCLLHDNTSWKDDMEKQMMQASYSFLERAADQGATTAVTSMDLKVCLLVVLMCWLQRTSQSGLRLHQLQRRHC